MRPVRAKAPSPGHRPGDNGNQQCALKGQKLLAQGIALGIMAISNAPCKGKSFIIIWFFEAFALTGRQVCKHIYPGRCPGLGATALSGRIGCNNFQTKKSPYKFRHLSPGLWGELVSDNFMISIEAIAHGLSPSVP